MEGVRQAVTVVLKRAYVVADFVAYTAFHLGCSAKEFAESGFGVPKLVVELSSLSIMGCAFAGHASVGMDVINKLYGKKECVTCNGWEGLRCTACRGTGKIQYLVLDSEAGESSSAQSAAQEVAEGRATLQSTPGTMKLGHTLPSKACSLCSGTGVMKCTECDGNAWIPGFHTEKIVPTPTKALNAYKKLDVVPDEFVMETLEDPATAEFMLFTRPELEANYQMDDDVKKEIWWRYEEWRRKRLAYKAASSEEPGWEAAQQVLVATDPVGTLEDPFIVKNVSYHLARKAVEAEVQNMAMPPRPSSWTVPIKYPIKESDWTEEDLKDPKKKEERDVLLKAQASIANEVLDEAWEREWRERTIQELTATKIEKYVKTMNAKPSAPVKAQAAPTKPVPAAQEVKPAQSKMSKEEKKKQERRERAERLAKQAADREAALKKKS